MSDQPNDPWAKWRRPEAPAVETPAAPPVEAVTPPSPVMPPAPGKPARVAGTLHVIKQEKTVAAPAKKRGVPTARPSSGAEERRPRAASESSPRRGGMGKAHLMPPKPAHVPSAPRVQTVSDAGQGVRLSKVMSERGLCSRREADLWIERGWVVVDGQVVSELGSRVSPDATITIAREAAQTQAKQVTILLNKPVGYVSGQPEGECIPAVTLIHAESQKLYPGDPPFKPWMLRGLAPAGRLDVDSTGLLILTQDGRIAKKLIGEDSDVEKEYLVRVEGKMVDKGLDLLRHGLSLDGKPLKPARVKQLNEDQLHIMLKEGKKRQIRRMCELVGLKVVGLKRVRIGRVRLGDLPVGAWRLLKADESF